MLVNTSYHYQDVKKGQYYNLAHTKLYAITKYVFLVSETSTIYIATTGMR